MKTIIVIKEYRNRAHAILLCSRLLHAGAFGFVFTMKVCKLNGYTFEVEHIKAKALNLMGVLDGIDCMITEGTL